MNRLIGRFYPSLGVPAYRVLWIGMVPSLFGFHMGVVAAGFASVTLTESAFIVALVGGAWGVPIALIPLIGGAAADHRSRRWILTISHMFVAASALVIASLSLAGALSWWSLALHGLVVGTTLSFITPARISYSIDAVAPQQAANAIAAFFFGSHVIAIVGPGLAGALLGIPGIGIAGSYVVIGIMYGTAGLILSRLAERPRRIEGAASIWVQVRNGFTFVRSSGLLVRLLLLTAVIAYGGMSYIFVLPVFSDQVLKAGPEGLGALVAASGVGGLAGSVIGSALRKAQHLWWTQRLSIVGSGAALVAFATTESLWTAVVWVTAVGLFSAIALIANSTLILTQADSKEFRGRLSSLYQMTFALGPIGAIPIGRLADGVGSERAIGVVGFAVAIAAVLINPRRVRTTSL